MSGAPPRSGFLARLGDRIEATGTSLCVGVDPDPSVLPADFPRDLAGVERFARLIVEACAPHAAALKFNLAFFEAWGSDGIAALERIRSIVPEGVPVVADAKRGDIASTAMRHAAAVFDRLDAHAVTANPYLGSDALEPLLTRGDRFVYVLCRTSNAGARELQDLVVGGPGNGDAPEPLYLRVARLASGWGERYGTVGLVLGATAVAELDRVRRVAPELAFLVPGVGAQGGDIEGVRAAGPASAGVAGSVPGGALLVNVSRGVASAALRGGDPGSALAAAARHWSTRLAVLR